MRICRTPVSQGMRQLLHLMATLVPAPLTRTLTSGEVIYNMLYIICYIICCCWQSLLSLFPPSPVAPSLTVPLLSCHGLGSVALIASHPMGQPRSGLIYERYCICRDHPCPGSLWIAQQVTVYPGMAGNRDTERGGNLPHTSQRTLHEEWSQPRCNHGPT